MNSVKQFQRRSPRCLNQSESGRSSCLSNRSKKKNFVKDVKILLPVKCHWNPFSGFRVEVKNVSANQSTGRPSYFSKCTKTTSCVYDVEILLLVTFRWIPSSSFRGEVRNVSANQRPGAAILFCDWPEKFKLDRELIDILLPVVFRWIPFSDFRGKYVVANQRPWRPSCFPIGQNIP